MFVHFFIFSTSLYHRHLIALARLVGVFIEFDFFSLYRQTRVSSFFKNNFRFFLKWNIYNALGIQLNLVVAATFIGCVSIESVTASLWRRAITIHSILAQQKKKKKNLHRVLFIDDDVPGIY